MVELAEVEVDEAGWDAGQWMVGTVGKSGDE